MNIFATSTTVAVGIARKIGDETFLVLVARKIHTTRVQTMRNIEHRAAMLRSEL